MDREVEKRLKDLEVRYTAGRRAVVAALADGDGPRSAAELHDQIGPTVPLSSLYRSLAVLEAAGVVVPHFGAKGLTRYELGEWLTGHHHHLICVGCGVVEDIAVPRAQETRVRELVDEISSFASFTPLDHAIEIEGRCARCA
jgi:Fur family ferric uptake transcriptional regulator